jgi:hypothetical protein
MERPIDVFRTGPRWEKIFVRIDRNPFKVSYPKISYRLATTPSSRLYTLSPGLRARVRHAQPYSTSSTATVRPERR